MEGVRKEKGRREGCIFVPAALGTLSGGHTVDRNAGNLPALQIVFSTSHICLFFSGENELTALLLVLCVYVNG